MKRSTVLMYALWTGIALSPTPASGAGFCLCSPQSGNRTSYCDCPYGRCADLTLGPGEMCTDNAAIVANPHHFSGVVYGSHQSMNGSVIFATLGSTQIVGRSDGRNFALRPSEAHPGYFEAAELPNAPDLAAVGLYAVGAEVRGRSIFLPVALGGHYGGDVTTGDCALWFASVDPASLALIGYRTTPIQISALQFSVLGLPPQDCVTSCPVGERTTLCYEAGRADDYTAPVDPLAPRPVLLTTPVGSTYTGFDDPTPNRFLAHTFRNLPCGIQTATLTVAMKALPDIPSNDTIALNRPTLWGSAISALPGAGGTWNPGQTLTITLDLSALPGGGNIIGNLNSLHFLDLLVQDDTMIDWAKLVITVCPCAGPYRVLHAGLKDGLAPLPLDPPPYLRPALAALRTTPPFLWNGFDNTQVDRGVGHSFSVPAGIVNAQLLVRAMPLTSPAGGSNNDGISFELKPLGAPAAFYRGFNYNLLPTTAGTWFLPTNPATTLSFDLGITPPGDFSCPNFLGAMADGLFDVYSQDDTQIDWMDLKVWTCPPARFDCGIPVSATGEAMLEILPGQTSITNLGSTGNDGIRLDIPGSDGFCAKLTPRILGSFPPASSLEVTVSTGDHETDTGSRIAGQIKIQMGPPRPLLTGSFPTTSGGGVYIVACDGDYESPAVFLPTGQGVGLSDNAVITGVDWSYNYDVPDNDPPDRPDAFVVRFGNTTDFVTTTGIVLSGSIIKMIRPVPQRDRIAYATIGGTNLGTLQLMGVQPQQFGFLHAATGVATTETSDGALTVANIGGTGLDGLSVELGAAEVANLNFNASPAESMSGWPNNGELEVSYLGSHGGVPGQYLGYSNFTRRSGVGSLYADYTPVGANLKLVQVLDGGVLIGEVPSVAGTFVTHVRPRCISICLPECYFACTGELPDGCGKGVALLSGQRTACARWHWPRPVQFDLVTGQQLVGDEIRVLAQNAAAPFDFVSKISLTGRGMSEISFYGASATQVTGNAPPCFADYNQDGGIDGSDVSAFFGDWEAGNPAADVNLDGGVDGSDVQEFYSQWEAGGC